jgi:hypothetical protein
MNDIGIAGWFIGKSYLYPIDGWFISFRGTPIWETSIYHIPISINQPLN